MPDIRISDLPAAAAALLGMEFEVNDAGTSRKVTLAQILAGDTGLAPGSVVIVASGGALSADAGKLVWDAAAKRLGIGVAAPTVGLDYSAPTAPLMLREITGGVWNSPQSAITIGLKNAGGIVDAGSGPSFLFRADNSAGAAAFLGRLSGLWENRTAGAEAAAVVLSVRANGADAFAQTEALRVTAARDLQLNGAGNTVITRDRHHQLRSYTVATLPSAAGAAGQMIFVSNASGGAVPAYSDGVVWRRCTDATLVN
jgi:hypothetical protein